MAKKRAGGFSLEKEFGGDPGMMKAFGFSGSVQPAVRTRKQTPDTADPVNRAPRDMMFTRTTAADMEAPGQAYGVQPSMPKNRRNR